MPTINRKQSRPEPVRYQHSVHGADFYGTRMWRVLRESYISQHPLCECCLRDGRARPAEEVHHKQFWDAAPTEAGKWELFLDENNLMSLCRECHHKIHAYARHHNLTYCDSIVES